LASEILREARILHRKIADLDERIGAEVEASLAEQPHRDLRRGTDKWPPRSSQQSVTWRVSRAQGSLRFLYSGTAPIEASSSGEVLRHRLSPLAGNRRLNNALHMIALCQARSDLQGGGVYYRKKLAEGKSCKGALCGASRGASLMPSLRASWLIWGRAFMQCCLTKRSLEVEVFSEVRHALTGDGDLLLDDRGGAVLLCILFQHALSSRSPRGRQRISCLGS
jgi:hypothetical protein